LFNSSIGDASPAVEANKAYQEIVATVEQVREAAESAAVSSEIAHKEVRTYTYIDEIKDVYIISFFHSNFFFFQVFPMSNDDSVVEKSQNSKAVSSRLHSRAKAPPSAGVDLRTSLLEQQRRVSALQGTVQEAMAYDNSISNQLKKLHNLGGEHNFHLLQ